MRPRDSSELGPEEGAGTPSTGHLLMPGRRSCSPTDGPGDRGSSPSVSISQRRATPLRHNHAHPDDEQESNPGFAARTTMSGPRPDIEGAHRLKMSRSRALLQSAPIDCGLSGSLTRSKCQPL
jgi:hypothetical protein